jgi:hypothetical protein
MFIQIMDLITKITSFDYDYYFSTHMKTIRKTLGEHIHVKLVTKGISVGRMFLLDVMLFRLCCLKISPRWI